MPNNINMNKSLEKLNKQQLLSIISKMRKADLINVINQQVGGGNNAIRTEIKFNLNKLRNKQNIKNDSLAMTNNNIYEHI